MQLDADFVKKALKVRHPNKAWIYATEVRTSTGYRRPHNDGLGGIRFIDAFAMALWPSKGFQRVAYEIKVDRSDWLAELEEPTKRSHAYRLADKFYFVVTPGIWKRQDIPLDARDCGLIEVQEDGSLEIVHYCYKGPAWPMPEWFIASFLRRVRDTNWPDYELNDLQK